jgi:hypothetical protein
MKLTSITALQTFFFMFLGFGVRISLKFLAVALRFCHACRAEDAGKIHLRKKVPAFDSVTILALRPSFSHPFAGLAYIQHMRDNDRAVGPKTPGFTAMGIFLFFGSITASLAAVTLLWRGTVLDRIWALNPMAYKQLAPLGDTVGILFLLLGAALAAAGIGWIRRRLWGWRFTVVIIAIQVLGDVVSFVKGDWLRGGTGVIIAGAFLLFLLQPKIRATFA